MTTQVYESTKEKPFGFFEYFISVGFFRKKLNFFKDSEYFNAPIIEYSEEEEYYFIPVFDDDGNEKKFKVTFRDEISSLMENNFKKSLEIISENIKETYLSQGKVKSYLLLLINDISSLIDNARKNQTLIDYQIDIQLCRLLTLIFEKYKFYLNRNEIQPINEAYYYLEREEVRKEREEQLKNKTERNTLKSFEWIKPSYYYPVYNLLVDERIIDDNEDNAENFLKAFRGLPITEPPRIIWRLKSKKSDLAPLVRFLHFLMEKGFIKEVKDNSKFAHMIERLFLNNEGQPFKNTIHKTNNIKKKKDLIEIRLHQRIDELQPDTT